MADGANSVHQELKNKLENYVTTQYLGKSDILREVVGKRLDEEGILYRRPYIESSPAYVRVENGINTLNIEQWKKDFLMKLADRKLGVFATPFSHQLKALEAVNEGKDLFVATGTGSGKTECFMWPLLLKIADEAKNDPDSWEERATRVVIMYPMNALVSDQVSRLRKLIGDPDNAFVRILKETAYSDTRRPQFGMYTGRTPYPGVESKTSEDKSLAHTLGNLTKEGTDPKQHKFLDELMKNGKIPAKEDLNQFVQRLSKGVHFTEDGDAEMITRFEMQKTTPDILITNYSMLEYMLLRPIENNIWNDTAKWLNEDRNHKLLFIIDEAHMYRGSSGGEVALLIRRLFYRLGIERNQAQFILTTASMPDQSEEDRKAVMEFACKLTCSDTSDSFCYLTGERESLDGRIEQNIDPTIFRKYHPDDFENFETRLQTLNAFWTEVAIIHFDTLETVYAWMYENLIRFDVFCKLMMKCRGNAVSIQELANDIFPTLEENDALHGISVLLSIAPMARNDKGAILFPARMHMLFKGLDGIYACTNENCTCGHSDHTMKLGELFLQDDKLACPHCGSVIYELYNDRRCGALYYKGFVLEDEFQSGKAFYWRYPGQLLDHRMKELHLYIPRDNEEITIAKGRKGIVPCYLEKRSGYLHFNDDTFAENPNYRKLYYYKGDYREKGIPEVITFPTCPHCRHNFSRSQLSPLSTKGNQPFYNLIKSQFDVQNPVPGKDHDPVRMPNAGRKVLLFSDSRQRAARLARDMSEISETAAGRLVFSLAIQMMENANNVTLEDLCGYVCLVAAQKNVQLVHDEDSVIFDSQCNRSMRNYERALKRGKNFSVEVKLQNVAPTLQKMFLSLFGGGYNTLTDTSIAWIEPLEECVEQAVDNMEDDYDFIVSEDQFKEVFNAWFQYMMNTYLPLGNEVSNEIRSAVSFGYHGFGIPRDWDFPKEMINIMDWKEKPKEMEIWKETLNSFLEDGDHRNNPDRSFFMMKKLKPHFGLYDEWFRCERCSEITPYRLIGKCPSCGSDRIKKMTPSDLESFRFWREPVEAVLNGADISVIDTEEHTAQLSHKDQRDSMWSKTEQYELRFQDLLQEDEKPVDVLSSTTTMEVGIDIGSLVAVGLRNIPPTRENYQQRAGRAGRRGSSLSTIVTYCENGPYDTMYFNNPVPMFRGDPRTPWIDVESEKLIQRHINIILFEEYMKRINESLDQCLAHVFLRQNINDFLMFVENYRFTQNILISKQYEYNPSEQRRELEKVLLMLRDRLNAHPELFNVREDGVTTGREKKMLDVLYEEGIIPTYSFPKNVISTYIYKSDKAIEYQVERGLDVAISEYAPGRAIVVDKKTYQIGGLYYPGSDMRSGKANSPARDYMDDANYVKHVVACHKCGWFGLEEDNAEVCPFCGNSDLVYDRDLVKPWGFAPKNATSIEETQLQEEYSTVQQPLYSTLPKAEDMHSVEGYECLKMAARTNQRIIMMNQGNMKKGFMVCPDCGAAVPGDDEKLLKGYKRPYINRFARGTCTHSEAQNVNLGYHFITDMLVLEIRLDPVLMDTRRENIWLKRSAQSLAEAFRLAACNELDVEFTELVTGYRYRQANGVSAIDIYMYDSLSSGAGYSSKAGLFLDRILNRAEDILSECNCETACYKCLKHYRNQNVHAYLDRHEAMELLRWAKYGDTPKGIAIDKQMKLLKPLKNILQDAGYSIYEKDQVIHINNGAIDKMIVVYPAMCRTVNDSNIYVSDAYLKYAKPYSMEIITKSMGR